MLTQQFTELVILIGIANSDAGFIGGIDAGYANTGVYFVQKDNVSLGSFNTNLMNIVSNGVPQVLVNGTGNMRIGNQYYSSQCGGAVTATDVLNVKLAVMGGYSSFGSFNSDPAGQPAPPATSLDEWRRSLSFRDEQASRY